MPELTDPVPGFDDQQAFGLRTVAQQTAEAVVDKMKGGDCPVNCKSMNDVHDVVFGASEKNVVGLDTRVAGLEKFEQRVNRITWLLVTAAVGGIVSAASIIVPAVARAIENL